MQNLQQSIALLTRTPASLDALLRDLPEAWTLHNEGGNSWTTFDVVGHLIHCEHADWMPRIKHLLQFGDSSPFPPFDREGFIEPSQGKSLNQLVDDFASARSTCLDELRALNLQPADLDRTGLHPALGIVTLSQLLSTWATHDLSHLHQIARVMAYQYREAVGPWIKNLGVLQCNGHSS
jgi:hypothetical protein